MLDFQQKGEEAEGERSGINQTGCTWKPVVENFGHKYR